MPTVVIGNNTGDDYSGTQSVHLRSAAPTYNYGGYAYGYTASDRNSLLKFNGLSNISAPVAVSAAVLSQYRYASGGAQTASIHRCLRDWTQGTQSGADRANDNPDSCCWNEYGAGNSWSTAGGTGVGDRTSSADSSIASESAGYADSGDLSAVVEGWINGTYDNYGVHESAAGSAVTVRWEFATAADGKRPYLSVTYTTSGGTGNSYYYQQQQM
jgi:hypothetical protein